ncbi:MAG: sulfite exporter TauE/SafE family protein [Actinobacteria bacterium]|nr:sulfite exporter TauE/SafE family protein [Actinomycetota bacterium]
MGRRHLPARVLQPLRACAYCDVAGCAAGAALGCRRVAGGRADATAGAHGPPSPRCHHRDAASTGAVVGALVSGALGETFLKRCLAVVALIAAAAAGLRRDVEGEVVERPPDIDLGEERGTLAGTYPVGGGATPYAATRLPAGLAVMSTAGLVAGLAGASGGFIKTPATTEIMKVPVKVAASTTTFTVGITAAAALVVLAVNGRIDLADAAPVIAGSLAGGHVGARLQARFTAGIVRGALGVILVLIAFILFARS